MARAHSTAKILVLGGAGEADAAAQLLCDHDATLVWWGAQVPDVGLRHLDADFATFSQQTCESILRADEFTHLLDITHGFERNVSRNARAACAQVGAEYVNFRRPAWCSEAGDDWTDVADITAACAAITPFARVFTNVGRGLLPAFKTYRGRLLARQTVTHDKAPMNANTRYVFGTPPFSQESEEALLQRLAADAVLFRNTGGSESYSKVAAARALGLPMIMLSRPQAPEGLRLGSLNAVRDWVAGL